MEKNHPDISKAPFVSDLALTSSLKMSVTLISSLFLTAPGCAEFHPRGLGFGVFFFLIDLSGFGF